MHRSLVIRAETDINHLIGRAKKAQQKYARFPQTKVDKIFKNAALSANVARIPLAKMAVDETKIGLLEDKVIKNHFASEYIYNKYKNEKTCGIVEYHSDCGITKIAEPVGVIAGIVPTTNPTSTAIFKTLLSLKTRNAIIISPHPRAAQCTIEAARIVYEAAVKAGAPEGIISWINEPDMATTMSLMQHKDISLILATGGPAMVRSAMSSAHPAIGVGAGNTPVVVDDTADIKTAVSSIILSKTFDNGVICASEQTIIVLSRVYDEFKEEMIKRGAYFLKEGDETNIVRRTIIKDGRLNADIVGKSVVELADIFEIDVPKDTRLFVGEITTYGKDEYLSYEKLCPVLAIMKVDSFDEATKIATELIEFGGPGHTSVLYTSPQNSANIEHFQNSLKTVRILINTPASQGAIGDLYNFHLDPSLTLGCGTWGSTSVSANVAPKHLLNYKTISERRENMLWFRVPPKVYFKQGCLEVALKEFSKKKRAFIVTDKPLYDMGVSKRVTDILDEMNVQNITFYHVLPDPTIATIQNGLKEIESFKPDLIIAIGGGSPMDAAKVMWLLYEHPEMEFEGIAIRFMDIRKRVYDVPEKSNKSELVCIPTTSGTGSEVTPFSVVTDDKTGVKYPLADYALTPSMAIIDSQLVMNMPRKLTAYGGIDALTHALESYVSICATDFTKGMSKEAIDLLFKYLPRAYANGDSDPVARENVHHGATLAGMAFANAFLGICHSMAHKIGAAYHIPHGLANALLISHVIVYNATDAPFKQAIFSQYQYPQAKQRYEDIAVQLAYPNGIVGDKIKYLVEEIEILKRSVDIPKSISEVLGEEMKEEYMKRIDEIAEQAFDDQCTGANPRYPLIKDMAEILRKAWYGGPYDE